MLSLTEVFNDPDLVFRYHATWTSSDFIRRDLDTYFHDTEIPPRGPLSISHSPAGGAWVFSKKCEGIGIDVESKQRIKKETVERISIDAEVSMAPKHSSVWTGKEAVFKSLWPQNSDVVVSMIFLKSWKANSDFWTFEADLRNKPILGLGIYFEINDMAIACFQRESFFK